jgi:hypothetical protein
MKGVIIFLRALSVYKSIGKFITNDSFFNELVLSMSLLVKYIPMDYEFKYQQNFSSVKLLNLLVSYVEEVGFFFL